MFCKSIAKSGLSVSKIYNLLFIEIGVNFMYSRQVDNRERPDNSLGDVLPSMPTKEKVMNVGGNKSI